MSKWPHQNSDIKKVHTRKLDFRVECPPAVLSVVGKEEGTKNTKATV